MNPATGQLLSSPFPLSSLSPLDNTAPHYVHSTRRLLADRRTSLTQPSPQLHLSTSQPTLDVQAIVASFPSGDAAELPQSLV